MAEFTPRPIAVPMRPRSPDEPHRAATPLELFFDLVFVVAVAQAAAGLHHAIVDGHAIEGLRAYLIVFFAIWWAWMNFTWFASAYDPDDVPYRLVVFVQLIGALMLAAGVTPAFERGDMLVMTLGYVVMRAAMIIQWLRAGRNDPDHRRTTTRYALGVGVVQTLWVGRLFLAPAAAALAIPALIVAELLVPAWAERAGRTPWHARHIAERYGLFTIIMLGESILAATMAIEASLEVSGLTPGLLTTIVAGIVILLGMWWIYFEREVHDLLDTMPRAFAWGYGHYLVFAACAATGAGLAVTVDALTGHGELPASTVTAAVAWPVAIYLATLWLLHRRAYRHGAPGRAIGLVAVAVIAGAPLLDWGLVPVAAAVAVLVGIKIAMRRVAAA